MIIAALISASFSLQAHAQDVISPAGTRETQATAEPRPWKLTPTLAFAFNKEQLRDSSGRANGRISSHRQLALMATGTRALLPWLDAGLFFLAERGSRVELGGGPSSYTLFWTGPLARGTYGIGFLELGYVLFGVRQDEGLRSVASTSGDRSSAFRTDPSRAFLLAPGVAFTLCEGLEGVVKLEYRMHYYDRRGNDELAGGGAVGSQAIRPHLGVQWRL